MVELPKMIWGAKYKLFEDFHKKTKAVREI